MNEIAARAEVEALRAELAAAQQATAAGANQLSALQAQFETFAHRLAVVEQRLDANEPAYRQYVDARVADLESRVTAEIGQRERLSAAIAELGIYTHQTRATLSIQDFRLGMFIEEARKRLPDPWTSQQTRELVDEYDSHRYDVLYSAFEDVFRGSRQEIKARQSVYLPFFTERGIGSEDMPVLDLGCGRGEWLELLREQQWQARGVDRDALMIKRCQADGLDAVQADALTYLNGLDDASLGAITSFHMVEHLPFDITLTLVDAALRKLKPGGMLIFETPNPQNVLVGSYTFHLDPTHHKPLPSIMLRFFVEARGFCDVSVLDLHPYPESTQVPDDGKGVAGRLNTHLYGPQDYAVIGRKP